MNRRQFLGRAASACAVASLGYLTQGCNNKSGRQLGSNSTTSANLVISNRSANSLHVYLDGAEIGEVVPNGAAKFQVLSGEHTVEVRERGHTSRHGFGKILFGFNAVELTYRP